jgi:gliding motility-associated-like protein
MTRFLSGLLFALSLGGASAQVCDPTGNLWLLSNYDGGIVTINVDVNIPDLVIGISTYEPVQVTITGPFAGNVTQVFYSGMNSNQNNNNCGQGNFTTTVAGVPPNIVTINPPLQPLQVGYTPAHGNGTSPNWGGVVIGTAGVCDTTINAGGANTPDELVFHFEDQTGATLYAHQTQYACWQNDVVSISAGGNCCIDPSPPPPPSANICNANGNLVIYSNYEGGVLTINVDQNIPDLRVGICTYEAVTVNFTGPFVGNISEVIYAGFDGANGPCGTNPTTTTINGVAPGIVTQYSQTLGNIAIANFLGEPLAPGFPPLVNCIVGAEGECSTSNNGGGNSAPQIAQFFLAEFGPGVALFGHQVQYECFTGTFNVSDGGNCCLLETGTPPNPIYAGNATYDFIPWTDTLLCGGPITIDLSFYPVLFQPPTYPGYVWSDGTTGPVITITEPGTYSFIVGDYCHYEDGNWLTDTVVVLPCCSIGGVDVASTAITCNGANDGTITVTPLAAGPFTYTWNTAPAQSTPTITGLVAGSYAVTINDGLGCDTTLTFTLADPTPVSVQLVGNTEVCIGASTTLTANAQGGTGNISLDWGPLGAGNSVTLTPTDTVLVSVTATDANGCTATAVLQVNASICCPAYTFAANVAPPSCAGAADGTIVLQTGPAGPFDLEWNTLPPQNSATASGLTAGSYSVLITDQLGCDTTLTFTLAEPAPVSVQVTGGTPVCANVTALATALASGGTGAQVITWNTGANGAAITYAFANSGPLVATATDANGCSASDTLVVVVEEAPTAGFIASADTVCAGASIVFTANAPGASSLTWTLGSAGTSSASSPTALFSEPGTEVITLEAFGPNGCASTPVSDSVRVAPLPDLQLLAEPLPCERAIAVELLATAADQCVLWLNDVLVDSSCARTLELPVAQEGTYRIRLTASNTSGCADSITVDVTFSEALGLFVPNVFTPDGDGINDTFTILAPSGAAESTLRIFNRWGQEIFVTSDMSVGWNGTSAGEPVPDGVYIYQLLAPDPCETTGLRTLRGHVIVLR